MTTASAHGRISLLGNPSDIYGGKCISFTFDRQATADVQYARRCSIESQGVVERTLAYTGTHDLVKATLRLAGIRQALQVEYASTIPVGYGFAGSSAIVIATLRALNSHCGKHWPKAEIAERALRVEVDELGISAGHQDRYTISFGGLNFMDFRGKEYLRPTDPYGLVRRLSRQELPLFVCYGGLPKSSAMVHNPLRERFLHGDYAIKRQMDMIAKLAERGVDVIERGDWDELGHLMNENTALRDALIPPRPGDARMIEQALSYGARGAKLAGSGGAIVVLADKGGVREQLSQEYMCFVPCIIG